MLISRKYKFLCLVTTLLLGIILLTTANQTVYANDLESKADLTNKTKIETRALSTANFFAIAEKEGVDVKGILGEEEYQQALRQDMLRAGGSYVNKYTVGNETRYTVAVNSALVKVWKYGGSAALTAIQLYGASVGLPFDAPIYYGMKASLSNADASKGFKWEIGTSPWRVISSGVQ